MIAHQQSNKAAVSIAEMARMVGLSRSRFYQLVGTAMPQPNRDEHGRPYYDADQQQICLNVRHRNCGINGKPVLFYAARIATRAPTVKRQAKPRQAPAAEYEEILAGVQGLGLTTTAVQVAEAVKQIYPNGVSGTDPGQVIRDVFLSIRRQNQGDNAGR